MLRSAVLTSLVAFGAADSFDQDQLEQFGAPSPSAGMPFSETLH